MAGTRVYTINKGTDVTDLAISGTPTTSFDASLLSVYAVGIMHGSQCYAASGQKVVLLLSHEDAADYYYFNRYTATGGTLTDPETDTPTLTMPGANVTISATYLPIAYTINYDLDGGSVATDNPTTYTVEDEFTLVNPTRTGYTFAGWTGTGLTEATTDVTIAQRAYTATWTKNTKTLAETDDNTEWLAENDGLVYDVTLTRTLQTGGWNTFCVPFDAANPSGWTVKELTSSDFAGGTLTLNFADATSIEAGKPYLVKVEEAAENPTFEGVIVADGTTTTTETDNADFMPVINPTFLTGGDKSVLFVTGGNKLTYPADDGNINGFRAYFQLKGDAATSEARAFRMSFDDATGIKDIYDLQIDDLRFASVKYTLDGRRIQGQPTQKGLYIVKGKKTVIK